MKALSFSNRPLQRDQLLTILRTALGAGEPRYARQLALAWLAAYPGDLAVSLLHAQALLLEGRPEPAIPNLEELCQLDPEFAAAQQTLLKARQAARAPVPADLTSSVAALGGSISGPLPKGAPYVQKAQCALHTGALEEAETLIHQALPHHSNHLLTAVLHLRILVTRRLLPAASLLDLARAYHERWPTCLLFKLVLADTLMDGGAADQAVALLHQVVAQDVAGQVPQRLWGATHPYRPLWPDRLVIAADVLNAPQQIPVPAAVAAGLGWNQLPQGEFRPPTAPPNGSHLPTSSRLAEPLAGSSTLSDPHQPAPHAPRARYKAVPESLVSVQAELERVARNLKKPHLARSEGRFPLYVIFTTRQGLEAQYGAEGLAEIDREIKRLVEAVRLRRTWGAAVFYADEAACAGAYGLAPARPNDPWGLKLALADLDYTLGKRGAMIGALLIVGGPEIVPFHRLPNPVDDADADVPSDNPYATRDENYFIPEWPVGRLPGGAESNPAALLKALRSLTARHLEASRTIPWYVRWLRACQGLLRPRRQPVQPSLGYTAAIWRRAAISVFRPIGEPRALLVSPPTQAAASTTPPESFLPVARLGYFNLHGLPDAVEWYGQRDPSETQPGPDYPVALRPQDVVNSGRAPQVVFSEACYGAHILNKTVDQALALKFLASGSQAVAGSTCVAYGSIASPLIAADLLGSAFWKHLRAGMPAGEALRWAKISLAREMHQRQGYLDGEDQKTLISFVLYGDPLAQPLGQAAPTLPASKSVLRPLTPPPQVKTVCDRCEPADQPAPVPSEVLVQVKQVVSQYLPGMLDAQLSYTCERADCHAGGHTCPTAQIGPKARPLHPPQRQVVTLSKQVARAALVHQHYARLTLDAQGKLVKLVVSR
jgi:hypothetical protein